VVPTDLYGLSGQVLDGQFRIDRVVGEGGFSVVYRAQHLGLDEPVAIKCLKLQAQLGSAVVESFIRRFRDESKIHYRLSRGSLHIARTIAAGTTMAPATGALVPYMVLEWLEGFTLGDELRARRQRGERGRTIEEILHLFEPVADAMSYAHAQGVVHRDLTPSNIFFAHAHDDSSKLKVLDFGVAKVISDHALALGPRAVTLGHVRLFTPAYAAPEQFDETIGPITPQTDVYSLAVLVVELLGDRTPIEGEHIGEFADRALDRQNRPTPRALGLDVGDAVESVLARGVAVEPQARPRDIGELWSLLKGAAARDARVVRRGAGEGFPLPPQDIAPSARDGYVSRVTLGSLPAPPRVDLDEGRERIRGGDSPGRYSSFPGSSDGPHTRPDGAARQVTSPTVAAGESALRAAMGPRRATLFQGTMGGAPAGGTPPLVIDVDGSAQVIDSATTLPRDDSTAAFGVQAVPLPSPGPAPWANPPAPAAHPTGGAIFSGPSRGEPEAAGVLRGAARRPTKESSLDFWIGAALALTVALVLVALIASQLAR